MLYMFLKILDTENIFFVLYFDKIREVKIL